MLQKRQGAGLVVDRKKVWSLADSIVLVVKEATDLKLK